MAACSFHFGQQTPKIGSVKKHVDGKYLWRDFQRMSSPTDYQATAHEFIPGQQEHIIPFLQKHREIFEDSSLILPDLILFTQNSLYAIGTYNLKLKKQIYTDLVKYGKKKSHYQINSR